MTGEAKGRRRACAAAVRMVGGRVELCLVAPPNSSRWELPAGPAVTEAGGLTESLRAALRSAGLPENTAAARPVDELPGPRGSGESLIVFVTLTADGESPLPSGRGRRRWCLLEEAERRVRRKPLRRLLRRIELDVTKRGRGPGLDEA